MIPDAYMPTSDQMAWLISTVAAYGACGIGFGLIGWAVGYMVWFVVDLIRGFTL